MTGGSVVGVSASVGDDHYYGAVDVRASQDEGGAAEEESGGVDEPAEQRRQSGHDEPAVVGALVAR